MFYELAFRKFKLRNGLEYAQIGTHKKLFSQQISVKSNFQGIEWLLGLNIAWLNESFYIDGRKRTVIFQSQISYTF